MLERILSLYERARESLLVVPLLLVVLGVLAAWVAITVDAAGDGPGGFLVESSVPNARAVLTTVAGATASVAGIVFALTAVAVQLASSAYSSRVIQGYMRDGVQQAVIGLVGATFAYSLLTLASITDPADGALDARPRLTVTLGVVLGVASFLAIIVFIDHSVRSLRADAIIRRLSDETIAAVRLHHPEVATPDVGPFEHPDADPVRVSSNRRGWVRTVDRDGLLESLPAGTIVRLDVGVGQHVYEGARIASVWLRDDEGDLEAKVRAAISVGRSRTIDQDPLYGIRLMVDVGLRALSPGVNDPTTAVTTVRHLTGPIGEVLARDLPPRVFRGADGRRLYEPERPDDDDFVRVAFRELRLAARGQPEVLEALGGVLVDLAGSHEEDTAAHRRLAVEAERVASVAAGLDEVDRQRVVDVVAPLVGPD